MVGESRTTGAARSKTPKERLFKKRYPQRPVSKFGTVVQALWPDKPALNLSQRAGCTERYADYLITGRSRANWRHLRAVIDEIS